MQQPPMQNKWLDLPAISAATPETLGPTIRRLAVLAAAAHRAQVAHEAETAVAGRSGRLDGAPA